MDLKNFIESVLTQLDSAVSGARKNTARDIAFSDGKNIEFDIAVTVETNDSSTKEGAIKVFEFLKAGIDSSVEDKNKTISRIKFSLQVEGLTKTEVVKNRVSNNWGPGIKEFN